MARPLEMRMAEILRWTMERPNRRQGVDFPNGGPGGIERRGRSALPTAIVRDQIFVGDREREKFKAEGYVVVRDHNPPCPHCGKGPQDG